MYKKKFPNKRLGRPKTPDNQRPPINSPKNVIPGQANRVLTKFGGHIAFRQTLLRHGIYISLFTALKWQWPRHRGGSGGYIPTQMWDTIFHVARLEGIFLSSEDCDPRPIPLGKLNPAPTLIDGS